MALEWPKSMTINDRERFSTSEVDRERPRRALRFEKKCSVRSASLAPEASAWPQVGASRRSATPPAQELALLRRMLREHRDAHEGVMTQPGCLSVSRFAKAQASIPATAHVSNVEAENFAWSILDLVTSQ